MANDCVRPGRNHLLILGDFDGCGRERVFSVHDGNEIEPNRNEQVSGHNTAERNDGPPEAVVERWHDKKRYEAD